MEERYIYKIPVGFEAEIEEDMVVMHPKKESEDERIGKEIIEYIKVSKPYWSDFKDYRSWVAWLEKQKRLYSDYEESELRRGLLWHLKELQNIEESKGLPIKAKATYGDWIAWLEKQKEQKPAEWSEEDEAMRQDTIYWFEHRVFPYALENENPARDNIKWLKSLRPQPHWKPSEEQMDALKNSAYGTYQNGDGPALRGLYNDLKKLM